MLRLRFLTYISVSTVLIATALRAQISAVAPRILTPVNEQSLTTLKGNVSPAARAEFDKGEASPLAQLRSVRIVLSRSKEQQAALDSFMAAQLDKTSPDYHHWLTPDEFDRRFGPADSDMAAIVAWLQSQGLTVKTAPTGRTSIAFSGSVSQIEKAFHTSIHAFQRDGVDYSANITEPKIPSALVPVVSGVAHLSTYAPVPHLVNGRSGRFDPKTNGFTATGSTNRLARPDLTTTAGGNFLWITAADAATMYDTPNAYNAAFSAGTSYTGKGVTIGIGGVADINPITVVNYRNRFLNGDLTAPTVTNIDSSAVIGDATDEAYIDNELSGGVAPGAKIHFYTADNSDGGLVTVMNQVIADNSVDIFSLSFGQCEYYLTTSDNQLIYGLAQNMAALGIAITVSTGDSGAAGCDDPNPPNPEFIASAGLQVNGFASTPFNIAVGGTDTYGLRSSFSTYVNNNQGPTDSYRSVKSYIPEATWNDSTSVNGQLANNKPAIDTSNNNETNIVGGSGGVSACSTQTVSGACASGYAKPTWQRGTGVPNDHARDLPDISLMAGNGGDHAAWLVCVDDIDLNSGFPKDCEDEAGGQFYFAGFGGTSTSAPAFAGMLALVQESLGGAGHRLGAEGAKTLYDLFNGSHASAVFHDIKQGNISVYCTAGTPDCATNTAGHTFLTGYDTTTGYDLATGLGSVDATNLVKYWPQPTGSGTATVTLTPSATSITTAQSLTVDVTIAGRSGTPTGTVSLSGGGYASSTVTLDASGKASFSIPAGALDVGTDTLTLAYDGDSNYASATGTTSITVTLLTPVVTVTPASTSISADQPLHVTVKVTGSGATPLGSFTLSSGTYTSPATKLSAGSATIAIPANALAVGTDTLTASYNGDSVYAGASGTASVTVTALTPGITVTPASTTVDTAQPLNVTVKVTGTGSTPTGTVTLSATGYTSTATSLSAGSATITIPANTFSSPGAMTLTATYSGDTVYSSGMATASVTINPPYSLAATKPSAISAGGSATSTITVKSDGSYSGTVAMSCSLASSPSGAQHLPACSVTAGSSLTFDATHTSQTSTVTISTTAPTSASLDRQGMPRWTGAGGAVLALLFLVGMPARRRGWRSLLGVLILIAALGSLSACGGSSGGGGKPGTTAGTYTFTVTGAGTPAITPAPTTTVTLTVN
jgi:trimeric autotransporter adhesin